MENLPYITKPVKVIDKPNKKEFSRLVELAYEPFKVTGRMIHWPLFRIMSQIMDPMDQCDYLANLLKKEKIYFTVLPPEQKGHFGLNNKLEQNFSFKSRRTYFPEFTNEIKKYLWNPSLGNLYLQSTEIEPLVSMLGNIDLFEEFVPMSGPRFWIGTGNQFINLHNDPSRNIIALFTGRKRVIMFPPEELPNIYPAPFDRRAGGVFISLINVYNPDLKKFPRFEKALEKVKVAIINPGEFLYIPPLWWHAVEGEGFNLGLNCWFYDDGKQDNIRSTYLPAESLLFRLNKHHIPRDTRENFYKKFIEVIESDVVLQTPKEICRIEYEVLKVAKKIRYVITNNSLTPNQKNVWKKWVSVFAYFYIFCLQENPFPTLSNNEFSNMIRRMKKNSTWRIFHVKFYVYCLKNLINSMKKIKNHGIVAMKNDTSVDTVQEFIIRINFSEIYSKILINLQMGGAFIYHEFPPVVGTVVKIKLISKEDLNLVTIKGSVNWSTSREIQDAYCGFGIKWADTDENINKFIEYFYSEPTKY